MSALRRFDPAIVVYTVYIHSLVHISWSIRTIYGISMMWSAELQLIWKFSINIYSNNGLPVDLVEFRTFVRKDLTTRFEQDAF